MAPQSLSIAVQCVSDCLIHAHGLALRPSLGQGALGQLRMDGSDMPIVNGALYRGQRCAKCDADRRSGCLQLRGALRPVGERQSRPHLQGRHRAEYVVHLLVQTQTLSQRRCSLRRMALRVPHPAQGNQ